MPEVLTTLIGGFYFKKLNEKLNQNNQVKHQYNFFNQLQLALFLKYLFKNQLSIAYERKKVKKILGVGKKGKRVDKKVKELYRYV